MERGDLDQSAWMYKLICGSLAASTIRYILSRCGSLFGISGIFGLTYSCYCFVEQAGEEKP